MSGHLASGALCVRGVLQAQQLLKGEEELFVGEATQRDLMRLGLVF